MEIQLQERSTRYQMHKSDLSVVRRRDEHYYFSGEMLALRRSINEVTDFMAYCYLYVLVAFSDL
jgi:hypothetical protein